MPTRGGRRTRRPERLREQTESRGRTPTWRPDPKDATAPRTPPLAVGAARRRAPMSHSTPASLHYVRNHGGAASRGCSKGIRRVGGDAAPAHRDQGKKAVVAFDGVSASRGGFNDAAAGAARRPQVASLRGPPPQGRQTCSRAIGFIAAGLGMSVGRPLNDRKS